ncbi:hypothetical protein [Nonomuraea sp. NPDC049695]|uniref:alpha/beta fold hydrolase n=1 Tax=Nonomuraea sp. NPDC049695 TaxID=3154734 RepID=UPI0034335E47
MIFERAVILVHSPVLAPSMWQALAPRLEETGLMVATPDLRPSLAGSAPYHSSMVEVAAAAVPTGMPVVLVGHSAAGPLLPGIAACAHPPVTSIVYLDARLPHPGRSWLDTLPPPRADALRTQVAGDRMPRWNEWFPPEAFASLLPDERAREDFVKDLPEVPWEVFTEVMPAAGVSRLPERPLYVQLSEAYRATADEAEEAGYQVLRAEATHLAMMTDPSLVMDLLLTALT